MINAIDFNNMSDADIISSARREYSELCAQAKEAKDRKFANLAEITDEVAEGIENSSPLLAASIARNYVQAQRWYNAANRLREEAQTLAEIASNGPDVIATYLACGRLIEAARGECVAREAYQDCTGE